MTVFTFWFFLILLVMSGVGMCWPQRTSRGGTREHLGSHVRVRGPGPYDRARELFNWEDE